MRKSIFCFLLFYVSIGSFFSQNADKGSPVLDSIAKSIRSKENLTIEWETSFLQSGNRIDQKHFAKIKGIKFYYQQDSANVIICDGEMVYRRKSYKEKAQVSNRDTTVDYNPIKVLTFFGEGFKVNKIKRNKNNLISTLSIKTIDKDANMIQEAFLYFDEKGSLAGITFKSSGDFVNYVKINRLDSSTVLKDSEFEIPK